MPEKSLTIRVGAKDDATPIFKRIGDSLDKMEKGALGGRGGIKDFFEILKGGGAVVGLTYGAQVIGDMARKAGEMRDAMRDGSMGAGDMAEGLIQALPVLGEIRKAGLAIRELFTGEQAGINAMLKSAESAEKTAAAIHANSKLSEETAKRSGDEIAKMRRKTEIMGMDPTMGWWASQQDQSTEARDRMLGDDNQTIKKMKENAAARRAELAKELQGIIVPEFNEFEDAWGVGDGQRELVDRATKRRAEIEAEIKNLDKSLSADVASVQQGMKQQEAEFGKLKAEQMRTTGSNFFSMIAEGFTDGFQKRVAEENASIREKMRDALPDMLGMIWGPTAFKDATTKNAAKATGVAVADDRRFLTGLADVSRAKAATSQVDTSISAKKLVELVGQVLASLHGGTAII